MGLLVALLRGVGESEEGVVGLLAALPHPPEGVGYGTVWEASGRPEGVQEAPAAMLAGGCLYVQEAFFSESVLKN